MWRQRCFHCMRSIVRIFESEIKRAIDGILHDHGNGAVRIAQCEPIELNRPIVPRRTAPSLTYLEKWRITYHPGLRVSLPVFKSTTYRKFSPAPCTHNLGEHHPIDIGSGTVAQITIDQMEHIFRIVPRVVAGSAFELGLLKLEIGPRFMSARDGILPSPLVADAIDIAAHRFIEENVVDETIAVIEAHAIAATRPRHILGPVHRTAEHAGVDVPLLEGGVRIVSNEDLQVMTTPQTTWELPVGKYLAG